jgi:hypothetical protein
MGASLEGKTYAPINFTVDAERVHAFARAVGHRSNGVPPTIVTAPEIAAGLANVVADPDLGIDLRRVLHGEQEYAWNRPVAVGETLTAESRIESIRGKSAMRFLTLRTEIRGDDGDLVAVGRSTLVVRGGG